jgi:hypothetical protein
MLILFDHGRTRSASPFLKATPSRKAKDARWDWLANGGGLLDATEAAGFDLLLTTDKNMRCQQNLTGRKLAIVVLGNSQWRVARRYIARILAAVKAATPGQLHGSRHPARVKAPGELGKGFS